MGNLQKVRLALVVTIILLMIHAVRSEQPDEETRIRDREWRAVLWDYDNEFISQHDESNIMSGDIYIYLKASDLPIPDSVRTVLETIASDPLVAPTARIAAISGLKRIGEEVELPIIQFLLNDESPEVQGAAAGIMIDWGYWDEGKKILIQNQDWRRLIAHAEDKAEAIIRDAMLSLACYNRLKAAKSLMHYGDYQTSEDVARSVLKECVLANNIALDQRELFQIAIEAFSLLGKSSNPNDIVLMKSGLLSTNSTVRWHAMGALSTRIQMGSSEAYEVFYDASQNNPYEDVRKRTREQTGQ